MNNQLTDIHICNLYKSTRNPQIAKEYVLPTLNETETLGPRMVIRNAGKVQ